MSFPKSFHLIHKKEIGGGGGSSGGGGERNVVDGGILGQELLKIKHCVVQNFNVAQNVHA